MRGLSRQFHPNPLISIDRMEHDCLDVMFTWLGIKYVCYECNMLVFERCASPYCVTL